jgi:hypothetical protein
MNAVAPRRNVARSLEVIAEFVSADPARTPVEFVRELARFWKEIGGLLAGKSRHSDRYLDDLLRRNDTPVRSLTPKLAGRTHLRPGDAEVLVRTFLTHWEYKGDPYSGEITARPADQYRPLLPEMEIEEVCTYVAERIEAVSAEVRGAGDPAQASAPLPGHDMMNLMVSEFQEASAMFVVGAGRTMLVADPDKQLIPFRDLMNRLWAVEKKDERQRLLIWMLELGRQRFEDHESIFRFMNVEAVLARFKAMKRFKESDTEARWNWLRSRAMIVLHDTSSGLPAATWLPTFDPHHVLFSAVPPRWVTSPEFNILYGGGRIFDANYTIYLRKTSDRTSEQQGGPRYQLRYFGNVVLKPDEKSAGQFRGLQLGSPGESYTEALGTVFVAAARSLGLQGIPAEVSIDNLKISPTYAKEKLQHHGFLLLSLDDFMKF